MGVGPITPASSAGGATLLAVLDYPYGESSWTPSGGSMATGDAALLPFWSSDVDSDVAVDDYNGDLGIFFPVSTRGVLRLDLMFRVKLSDSSTPSWESLILAPFLYASAGSPFRALVRSAAAVSDSETWVDAALSVAVVDVDEWALPLGEPTASKNILFGATLTSPVASPPEMVVLQAQGSLVWQPLVDPTV